VIDSRIPPISIVLSNFDTDILISATTQANLEESIAVERLQKTTVKGKREPVEIF